MVAASIFIPRGSPSCLSFLQEALQDQQVGLTLAPFKLLLLCRDSEYEILGTPFKSKVSCFLWPLGSPEHKPPGFQSQMFWGLVFLVQDPQAQPTVGLGPFAPWGGPL